ncbi:MAG: AMP-binding protein [Bacteroidales bacterium]|nr:AMP-binding protein [Bacteroidales bacterium]MDD6773458.1 AMP-binding protein [Bacteroidales bacterium]
MENKRITIIDFVEKYTAKYDKDTFLREKVDGVWTETSYAKTREEGRILAAGFMALGLGKGEKVSLISEGKNLWVLTELGILYAGGVNVPLSAKLEETNDLTFRINHSDSRFVVSSKQQLSKVRRAIPQCPNVEKVIVFEDVELQENEMSIKTLREMGVKFLEEHPGELEKRIATIGPDDYANISYTSGTTADPKGILLTHRNYTANVEQGNSVISIDRGDVMLILLPLDHCFAHVAGFYTMMFHGGSIATVPVGKNPLATLKNVPGAIKEVRPMVMLSVPALARNFKKNIETGVKAKGPLVEKLYNFALNNAIKYNKEYYNRGGWRKPLVALFDKLVFKSVRENFGGRMKFFVGGGALLDIELQRYFCAIGIPMFQGYGLSEATPIICANSMGHARFGSSGRIVRPMECVILDSEGKEVPYGEKGEIVVKGENVMAGYWKNPESTAKTVVDGWLHTGDMGYICPEDHDFLYVTGRFKSLLISADGEKYSPEGFEDSLTDGSKFIDQVILHNDMKPYTILLLVPNMDALKEYVKSQNAKLDPQSVEAKKLMLDKLQAEIDNYKTGGSKGGMFPDRWLPAAIAVLPEAFTERNGLVNSTMKIVRGKVEKYFADRIDYAYTPEGKLLYNEKNLESLK